jgi:nicotinamidase-related amidase
VLVPDSSRKRALIIVDVQKAFVKDQYKKRNVPVLKNIATLIKNVKYDLYIEAMFYADKGSIWDKQSHWIAPKDENFPTVPQIEKLLKKRVLIVKTTKSAFYGKPSLLPLLKQHKIKEVHVIGYETHDCVLATANDSFDQRFFTYVIEECTESTGPIRLRNAGFQILRSNCMTNNSVVEKIKMRTI